MKGKKKVAIKLPKTGRKNYYSVCLAEQMAEEKSS